jgi:hypothetical protein
MSLAAALLLLAADPAADLALLKAFEAPCAKVQDYPAMQAAAPGAGWQAIAESAAPRVAALIDKGRKAMEPDEKLLGATFQRAHAGRTVYLILSRVEMKDGMWGNGCRLYDFDAPQPIDISTVKKWIGKEPTGVQDLGGGLVKNLWEPWVDGYTFEANYVPAENALAKQWGLSGVVLVSGAIGGF